MSFTPPYEIDPSPTGDTVKEAVGKNEDNIEDIYGNLNMLQSQISVLPNTGQKILDLLAPAAGTGSGLDADKLDGFHASNFSHISHSHPEVNASAPGFMATLDKQKLDGIAPSAEVNVQSDWDENNSSEDAFIRNKPKVSLVEGAPADGDICLFTGPMTMRGATTTEMHSILEYFKQSEFINQTAGSADSGKPIILGADGLIHASMIPAVPTQTVWGAITGTLSDQDDLQAALDLKAGTNHDHVMADITDLLFPVTSVNGNTGNVSLDAAAVGALPSGGKAADSSLINGEPRTQFVSTSDPDSGQGVDGDLWLKI